MGLHLEFVSLVQGSQAGTVLGFEGWGLPLGRPLGYSIFSLMALIRDPIYYFFFQGC